MKSTFIYILFFGLIYLLPTPSATAQSWVKEGVREFEELRMRQLQTVQNDSDIAAFTTDGCSGAQSHNWKLLADTFPGFEKMFGDKPPWEACCVTHDKVYWHGSTVDGYPKRKQADEELKQCIIATGNKLAPQISHQYSMSEEKVQKVFSVTAGLMYKAVRLGGQPCSLLPWRWGYGWSKCAFARTNKVQENYSDVKRDEHITLFNTAGWLDTNNAYWHIPIHVWIYEPQDSTVRKWVIAKALEKKYDLTVSPDTERNFRQRTNLMIADNERGKRIVIRIAGQDIVLPDSKENGHVFTVIKLPAELVKAFSQNNRLHYFSVLQPGDKRRFEGDVQLVPRKGISIISDIDDTIKISNVTDHKQLLDNTFFKDFKKVPGMSDLYHQLANHDAMLHFVSSSPWQLYGPLQAFSQMTGFPWATMNLKYIRFRDETLLNLFKEGTETKPEQIEPILQRYPERQFILVGDSGEQDPEVYGDIARRYPSQISHILIRNVDRSSNKDERYRTAFKDIEKRKWQIFDHPDQISIGRLISPAARHPID